MAQLEIKIADITALALDAIVNAANSTLLGGGELMEQYIAPQGRNYLRNVKGSGAAPPGRRVLLLRMIYLLNLSYIRLARFGKVG